jgi:hypothetical protein
VWHRGVALNLSLSWLRVPVIAIHFAQIGLKF